MCITCVLNHMSKSLSIICSRLYEKSNRFCDIFSMNVFNEVEEGARRILYPAQKHQLHHGKTNANVKFEFCRDKDTFIKTVWQKLGQTDQDVDL